MALLSRSLEMPSTFCCLNCSNSTKEAGFIKAAAATAAAVEGSGGSGASAALNFKARLRDSKDCCESGDDGVARPSEGVSKNPPRVGSVGGFASAGCDVDIAVKTD